MSPFQRISLAIEHVVMTYLVPRDRPGPVWRVIFKQPIWLYKLGLGWLIGKGVLLLHTTGRKTGKHRITPLEYRHDPVADTYTVMAGWGGKTDWYRNACANPHVYIQVGRRAVHATARPVSRGAVAHMLAEMIQINPRALQMFARWSDEPVDGSMDSLRKLAVHYPSLVLHPVDDVIGAGEKVDLTNNNENACAGL
ncbi:MAG: nitroreductase family deazaflavin-dependent oxidoreductase [Anaerolineae bacterium]|nr:nitroreductase family deazaflavin-dependent oxidoreductase [Anaerolineae bacterium]